MAELDADSSKGQPPVAPAQLGLALILQAYTGASEDEVIEATVMDRRWRLVLDCLDAEQPPFSKGTVFNFGTRLIQADLDRRLVERPWRWRRARPRAGSFGRRWIPVRCGGWPGGGHRQLDGTRPGQGLGGDRAPAGVGLAEGPRCWPNRQAPGCWPPPA